MADVIVTVNIDGKQAYVHGGGNAPDGAAFAAAALQIAADHFRAQVATRVPTPGFPAAQSQAAKDNSL